MSEFLDLHRPGAPLLMPNPWDVGSARVLASLGFGALATTSSGFAATLGRPDGGVTRDEALAHAAAIAAVVDVPVSADTENCFADDPEGVAETVRRAKAAGLAGCSVEDATGRRDDPIYDLELAVERVAAAVEAAGDEFVITARAENLLHGRDLADALTRLTRFAEAGAHVLFAPGVKEPDDIRSVVAIGRPVNVLTMKGVPPVAALAELGVARISVGGGFAFAALGATVRAAQDLLDGDYTWWDDLAAGRSTAQRVLTPRGTD